MSDIDSALGHHIHQVPVAKFVNEIPADAENDDCAIEMAATEEGAGELMHAADYRLLFAFAP